MNLSEFSAGFFEGILEDLKVHGGSAEELFVDRMCTYLSENGEVEDVQPCFWQKTPLRIKVNAYCYSSEDRRLSLFVAEHQMPYSAGKLSINRAEAERALRRGQRFYEAAVKGSLQDIIEESNREAFDLARFIKDRAGNFDQVDLYLLTNCLYKSNEAIELSIPGVSDVRCHVWDIERLFQLVSETQSVESFTLQLHKDLGQTFDMMLVPGSNDPDRKFDCYVGVIPGNLLAKAYALKGQRLIERNVRSFLQARGKVNRGIRDTLQKDRELFVAFNNGISTTAEDVRLTRIHPGLNLYRIDALTNWQIVNGGQTTASLHQALEAKIDLSGVFVQAKLTVLRTKDEVQASGLISRISEYANTQNKISFSDLGANESLQVQLEQVSRQIWAPTPGGGKATTKWFYERARGQYLVELNRQPTRARKNTFKEQHPKHMVITKTQFAKYYMTWEQLPHIVSKGNEANFTEFKQWLKTNKPTIDAEFFKQAIARGIIFTSCDDAVRRMDLPGYKANVEAYTVAMLSYAATDLFSLPDIWKEQGLTPRMKQVMVKTAELARTYLTNPPTQGTNISQWCKKEECWKGFIAKFGDEVKSLAVRATSRRSTVG